MKKCPQPQSAISKNHSNFCNLQPQLRTALLELLKRSLCIFYLTLFRFPNFLHFSNLLNSK
ncbi:unnamed protein product [Meloidogyne enterolobii]|uniref:Uncharacterized protein n=1 Tax=Meloidogyne enterolobii TaxID=390850 RepID=A0ACB1AEK9_MELEN